MTPRERKACLNKADEWVRLAQMALRAGNAMPSGTPGSAAGLARAYALQQCADDLRTLMEPVRRG